MDWFPFNTISLYMGIWAFLIISKKIVTDITINRQNDILYPENITIIDNWQLRELMMS